MPGVMGVRAKTPIFLVSIIPGIRIGLPVVLQAARLPQLHPGWRFLLSAKTQEVQSGIPLHGVILPALKFLMAEFRDTDQLHMPLLSIRWDRWPKPPRIVLTYWKKSPVAIRMTQQVQTLKFQIIPNI